MIMYKKRQSSKHIYIVYERGRNGGRVFFFTKTVVSARQRPSGSRNDPIVVSNTSALRLAASFPNSGLRTISCIETAAFRA